ncbi:glycosyltransferase family 39 protein [Candidatus Fukatsuia endosymbiont of Tuberolachnus salignus]|uniref:glycosyltransferase family 39 protein n=1 Tax=Candidatus Fukatsuia endosymbiont of Tuberolachnus salignus TaxID=3077957 RepID=UPI00313AC613
MRVPNTRKFRVLAILFIVLYAMVWTFVSYSFDPTVPYDAVEALNWANNLEFGSPKNPYMVGAVMLPVILFSKFIPFDFYWYATHFIAVSIGMLGIWLLSLRVFSCHIIAFFLLMSLNLSGVINFDIISYNDNYLLIMFWPYLFLFFIKALYDDKKYWLLLALVCGLAVMSKYSSLSFLPFMLFYTLITKEGKHLNIKNSI